ncbi:ATP-binding cassette domain-containing protein [Citricoccus parietis]|uniref:ATP-binding cassette domain-containing protein n=1 Tax=Citricoccus parietis TaxID=592307 RepID=A0ABV5G190_9MICC
MTGPNGSGKSTLLRVLAGRASPSEGTCRVLGRPVGSSDPSHRREIASLVDSVPVASDMTLREQLGMVAASWSGNTPAAAEDAVRLAGELRLTHLLDRFPHELSSGQLQLFLMSLVLVRPGQVVILDEPERHLDSDHVKNLADILQQRCRQGATIIMASHDSTLIDTADRRLELNYG